MTETKSRNMLGQKEKKITQLEQSIQIEGKNYKVFAKEKRVKRYRERFKQYWQNRTFQNNERKFYPNGWP